MTDPLRVLLDGHTLGTRAGGNERYVRGLLEGFVALEGATDVEIVVCVSPEAGLDGLRCDEELSGGPRIRGHRLSSRAAWRRLGLEIPRVLGSESPDLAHFQYVAPPVSPCPTVITIHDVSFRQEPASLGWLTSARLRLTSMWSLARARAVVVPSAHVGDNLVRWYPRLEGRISVIPLAPSPRFNADGHDGDVERRRAIGLPDRYLLYVGRRDRRKNLLTLVRGYARAIGHLSPPLPLCLVGPRGGEDRRLLREARRLQPRGRVELLDFVPDAALPAVYRGAETFLFPGISEGFGLPVLEAMACGCPVIAADGGAIGEVAEDAAILVPARDPDAWGDAIVRVTGAEPRRQRMRRQGLERAAAFSWKTTAEKTLDVYRASTAATVGTRR